ncbi:MAG: hypothetical protein ABUL69_03450 [Peristeroidobacter soli]
MFKKNPELHLKEYTLAQWRDALTGQSASGQVRKGQYELGPNQGGITIQTLPARPGRTYRVGFKAHVVSAPANEGADFRIGPVFLDADGKVVGWWQKQEPITTKERTRKGFVETVAPDNAAAVCIGAYGPWAQDGKPTSGVVAVSELSLTER